MAEMTQGELISLHMDFRDRYLVEFNYLTECHAFADLFFEHEEEMRGDSAIPAAPGIRILFRSCFEGLALSLSRIWDRTPARNPETSLSVRVLVDLHEAHDYFGFRSLKWGGKAREIYEKTLVMPVLGRLRVVRSEALAHMLVVGQSNDRRHSDLAGSETFDISNGELMKLSLETIRLLKCMLDDQIITGWDRAASVQQVLDRRRVLIAPLFQGAMPTVSEPN